MIVAGDELGLVTDQPGCDGESDTVGAAWKIPRLRPFATSSFTTATIPRS